LREFDEALGQLLARLRESGDLSQEALAAAIGRDQPLVSKVERGQRRVSVADLVDWLDALGVPLSDVAREIESIPRSPISRTVESDDTRA
jgi:transcriptional regulator with XRE-family HTH domain